MKNTSRLYSDLAWLWPMWGDANIEYANYCQQVVQLIRKYTRRPVNTLLNLGCGGGKNAFNLKKHFQITGLDLSPTMVEQAKKLNPDCEFIEGDIRSFAIDRTFDAVMIDDAISFMTNLADFSAAFRAAFDHLTPGGVLITTPDVTTETFRQNQTTSTPAETQLKPDNLDVVFVENYYDPNLSDNHYELTLLFLIRENGILRVETDHYQLGLFSLNTWKSTLTKTGLVTHEKKYTDGGENEYTIFACVKPE